jgi:threonine/homoserine/homoserine lactone efflux protein
VSSAVLNPKPPLFFVSFVPQFVDRDGPVALQVALLAGIHILIGFVRLTACASLVSRLQAAITRPRVKAELERATGPS